MNNQTEAARPAPKFAVGDWACDYRMGHNARIVAVSWDKALHGFTGGWRYSVPGLSDPYMRAAEADKPFVDFVETSPGCYKRAGGAA